jgi:hypothetical protein
MNWMGNYSILKEYFATCIEQILQQRQQQQQQQWIS